MGAWIKYVRLTPSGPEPLPRWINSVHLLDANLGVLGSQLYVAVLRVSDGGLSAIERTDPASFENIIPPDAGDQTAFGPWIWWQRLMDGGLEAKRPAS